jgi:hypothetical protein
MTNPSTDERRESGRLTHKDGEVLDWIRERLVNVHGDDTNADFIHALERVRLRVHAQVALSHQGDVVKVSDLRALFDKLEMDPYPSSYDEGYYDGCRDALTSAIDLTALISKAEKV